MLNLIENMLTKSTNFLFFVSYQHEKPEEPRTQPETNPNLKLVFVLYLLRYSPECPNLCVG